MILVERPILTDEAGVLLLARAGAARDQLVANFMAQIAPQIDTNLYKGYKRYLLRVFRNKCAYCETLISASQPVDIEHFRPKGQVAEEDRTLVRAHYDGWGEINHPGYFWLAYEWENLLPSCIDCNRFRDHEGIDIGKGDRFPIEGPRGCLPGEEIHETALLVDPTRTDPDDHFQFFKDGFIRARTKAGEVTLNLLGLNNREHLVCLRRAAFLEAWRAMESYIAAVASRFAHPEQIDELLEEVNGIWAGNTPYSAFGRLALLTIQAQYVRQGWQFTFPLRRPSDSV